MLDKGTIQSGIQSLERLEVERITRPGRRVWTDEQRQRTYEAVLKKEKSPDNEAEMQLKRDFKWSIRKISKMIIH